MKKAEVSFKAIAIFLAAAIFISGLSVHIARIPQAHASVLPYMPPPTKIVDTSPAFSPVLLRGLRFDAQDPFNLSFIVDEGDILHTDKELKQEADRLIKYFLASLTIPDEDLWVNLSPYEEDRITPYALGLTDMGRDLLGQDYVLKQLTSSLTYPESPLGQMYWNKIYKKAHQLYGTTRMPIDTFNKVWIVPDTSTVYVDGNQAFIKDARMKLMMEQDYLAYSVQRTAYRH